MVNELLFSVQSKEYKRCAKPNDNIAAGRSKQVLTFFPALYRAFMVKTADVSIDVYFENQQDGAKLQVHY
jgi:hypothetical protein